jgi:ubiquinone/menaquinone biosynthesis C-methylase UbiE
MEENTRQKKEKAVWEGQASGYDGSALKMYRHAYDLSIQKVRSILTPEKTVLEIGCGTGIVTLGIAPYAKSVAAVDISPRMIAEAERKAADASLSNVEFRVCDGYATPFEDGSFDVVLLFNTLHVVKEPSALLREARRLLKPSGLLASATDCHAEPVPFPVRLMLGLQKVLKRIGFIPFLWNFRKEDVNRLFKENSFSIVETGILHPAPVNYYLLASREAESGQGARLTGAENPQKGARPNSL